MKDVEIIGMLKSYVSKSLVGMGALKGGIDSISVNGVAQTISNKSVDLDVASNLITEAQWTQIQELLV